MMLELHDCFFATWRDMDKMISAIEELYTSNMHKELAKWEFENPHVLSDKELDNIELIDIPDNIIKKFTMSIFISPKKYRDLNRVEADPDIIDIDQYYLEKMLNDIIMLSKRVLDAKHYIYLYSINSDTNLANDENKDSIIITLAAKELPNDYFNTMVYQNIQAFTKVDPNKLAKISKFFHINEDPKFHTVEEMMSYLNK